MADQYERPEGTSDATVRAVGRLTEGVEWVERARAALLDFHHFIGRADIIIEDAADLLADAGHPAHAKTIQSEIVGRNVLDGRWSFQVLDEFDKVYFRPVNLAESEVVDELMDGKRYVYESEMKDRQRTEAMPGHERRPPAAHDETIAVED